MKILFIGIPRFGKRDICAAFGEGKEDAVFSPDYDAYLLASVAKQASFESDLWDLPLQDGEISSVLPEKISSYDGVVIYRGGGCPQADTLSARIRSLNKKMPILLVGSFSAREEEAILSENFADYLVRGDGEKILPRLLKYLRNGKEKIENISGVSYRRGDNFHRNADGKPLCDVEMERLPYPLYESLPAGVYSALSLETSRGNPFISIFDGDFRGRVWRSISSTGIFERVHKSREHFLHKFTGNSILLTDAYFTAKPKRLFDLASIYAKKGESAKLIYKSRCTDLLNENIVDYMGIFTERIVFEIPCGYNGGLIRFKAGYRVWEVERSAEILARKNMASSALYRFGAGFFGESEKEREMTFAFARKLYEKYGVTVTVENFASRIC